MNNYQDAKLINRVINIRLAPVEYSNGNIQNIQNAHKFQYKLSRAINKRQKTLSEKLPTNQTSYKKLSGHFVAFPENFFNFVSQKS